MFFVSLAENNPLFNFTYTVESDEEDEMADEGNEKKTRKRYVWKDGEHFETKTQAH